MRMDVLPEIYLPTVRGKTAYLQEKKRKKIMDHWVDSCSQIIQTEYKLMHDLEVNMPNVDPGNLREAFFQERKQSLDF